MVILIILLFFICIIKYYPMVILDKLSKIIFLIFKNNIFKNQIKLVHDNLNIAFPEKSEKEINLICYKSCEIGLLNIIIGLLGIPLYKYTNYNKSIKWDIPSQFKEDINSNGVILVGAHYGIFFNAGWFGSKLLSKIYFIYTPIKQIIYNYIYAKDFFKNMIFVSSQNSKEIYEKNKLNSGIIGIHCDQRPRNTNLKGKMNFLNRDLEFHFAPAFLLRFSNRKLWYYKSYYKNNVTYVTFEPLSHLISNRKDMKKTTQVIVNKLNKEISESPEQYMWQYKIYN